MSQQLPKAPQRSLEKPRASAVNNHNGTSSVNVSNRYGNYGYQFRADKYTKKYSPVPVFTSVAAPHFDAALRRKNVAVPGRKMMQLQL
jgi:hypothetical protein